MRTVFWENNELKMIDQRILPGRFEVLAYREHKEVAVAITDMVVRGAPAIGAAAAFGLALAGYESASSSSSGLIADLQAASATLKAARPTAVNLAWAVDRLMEVASASSAERSADDLRQLVLDPHVRSQLRMTSACQALGEAADPPGGSRALVDTGAGKRHSARKFRPFPKE